jgi:hypothetical protein
MHSVSPAQPQGQPGSGTLHDPHPQMPAPPLQASPSLAGFVQSQLGAQAGTHSARQTPSEQQMLPTDSHGWQTFIWQTWHSAQSSMVSHRQRSESTQK